jgi:hypothetical protein
VPRDTVGTRDGRRVVYLIEGDRARPVSVVEGVSDDEHVQIVSGLSAGDRVLADARAAVAPETRIRPITQ